MPEETPEDPPLELPEDREIGWHAQAGGGRRYWDGHGWLDLPTSSAGERRVRRVRLLRKLVAVGASVLAVLGIVGIAWASTRGDDLVANFGATVRSLADQESARRAAVQKAEDDRIAAQRAQRADAVKQLEASVSTMAQEHVAEGVYEGPVGSVACVPGGDASIDDLAVNSTTFDCTVTTGDGSVTQPYHATIDWVAGNYTYGFGTS